MSLLKYLMPAIAEPPLGPWARRKGAASTHFSQLMDNTETWENFRPLWAMVLRPAGFSRTAPHLSNGKLHFSITVAYM